MSTVNVGRLTANTKLNIPSYTQAQIDALDVETGFLSSIVVNTTWESIIQLPVWFPIAINGFQSFSNNSGISAFK